MTVFKDVAKEAAAAAELAIDLANGDTAAADAKATATSEDPEGNRQVKSVLLDPVTITRDNVKVAVDGGAVTADALDLVKLRDYAERDLAQRLLTTPGVASVDVVGGRERELIVTLDPVRLRGRGLTVRDVVSAVSAANRDEPGGAVTTGRREVQARTEGRFRSADELRELRIPLPGTEGARAAAAADLEAYLAARPDAPDVAQVRSLLERVRTQGAVALN